MPADVRLEGPAGTWLFILDAWKLAIASAREYGWEPEHQLSLYLADIGLDVSGSDAAGMADALNAWVEKLEGEEDKSLFSDAGAMEGNEQGWRDFAAFCRHGGFRVLSCPGYMPAE